MSENIGSAYGTLELDTKNWEAGFTKASSSLSGFSRQVLATSLAMAGVNSIQAIMTKTVQIVQDSTKQFLSFETAMAEVSTIVDTSKVNMRELEAGVVALSQKYGKDAGGLANALYETLSAGISAGDSIKFLETATRTAVGGVTNAKVAVDVLTSSLHAYGLTTDKAQEVSDSLFVAVKVGKIRFEEFSQVIGQVAPLAAVTGVKFDEMNSALAALTLSGLGASESGTALRGMLNAILTPTEKAVDVAKVLGVEFNIQAMKTKGLTGFLQDLKDKTHGSETAMAALFPEVRGLNGALQLTSEAGLKNYNDGMKEMEEKTGMTAQATTKMMETHQSKWDIMTEKINRFKRAAGNIFATVALESWEVIKKMWTDEKEDAFDAKLNKNKKTIEETTKATEELTQAEKDRLAEAAKAKKIIDDKIAAIEKAKDAAKRLAKEERDRERKADQMYQLEMQTLQALHEVRVRNAQAQIELIEAVAEEEQKTETDKTKIKIEAMKRRMALADMEYEYSRILIKTEYDNKVREAKGDKDLLDMVQKWYHVQSENIKRDWETTVTKELNVITKATIEMDKSTWAKLNQEISFNFRKWADDLKRGSTQAWSGFVGDVNNIIQQIGADFAGLGPVFSTIVNDIAGVIQGIMSGNPLQMISAAFAGIGDAINNMGGHAVTAANQELRAAEASQQAATQALLAAKAFLKSQGQIDTTLMSFDELNDYLGNTLEEIGDKIRGVKGNESAGNDIVNSVLGLTQLAQKEGMSFTDLIAALKRGGASDGSGTAKEKALYAEANKISQNAYGNPNMKLGSFDLNKFSDVYGRAGGAFNTYAGQVTSLQGIISNREAGGMEEGSWRAQYRTLRRAFDTGAITAEEYAAHLGKLLSDNSKSIAPQDVSMMQDEIDDVLAGRITPGRVFEDTPAVTSGMGGSASVPIISNFSYTMENPATAAEAGLAHWNDIYDLKLTLGKIDAKAYRFIMYKLADEYMKLAASAGDMYEKLSLEDKAMKIKAKGDQAVADVNSIDQAANSLSSSGFEAGVPLEFHLLNGAIAGTQGQFQNVLKQIADLTPDPSDPNAGTLDINVNLISDGQVSTEGAQIIADALGEAIVSTNRAQGVV